MAEESWKVLTWKRKLTFNFPIGLKMTLIYKKGPKALFKWICCSEFEKFIRDKFNTEMCSFNVENLAYNEIYITVL